MDADLDDRWSAPGGELLFWESWGEQQAVFDLRTGETHLLTNETARLLQQFSRCPGTVQEAAQRLCGASYCVRDARFLEHVGFLCLQLRDIGLIEKADR